MTKGETSESQMDETKLRISLGVFARFFVGAVILNVSVDGLP